MSYALKTVPLSFGAMAALSLLLVDSKTEGMALAGGLLMVGLQATLFAADPSLPLGLIEKCRNGLRVFHALLSKNRSAIVLALVLPLSVAFAAVSWVDTTTTAGLDAPATQASDLTMAAQPLRPNPAMNAAAAPPAHAMPLVAGNSEDPIAIKAQVLGAVETWREAWATQNIDSYLAAYSPAFSPANGSTRADWRAQRLSRIAQARDIQLVLAKLVVQINGDQSTVRFQQRYIAAHVNDTMQKVLRLVRSEGQWEIIEEAADLSDTPA